MTLDVSHGPDAIPDRSTAAMAANMIHLVNATSGFVTNDATTKVRKP